MEYRRYTEEEINEAVDTIRAYCKNMLENDEESSGEEKEHLREAYKILTETNKELRHTYESMLEKLVKSSKTPKTPVFTKKKTVSIRPELEDKRETKVFQDGIPL